MTAESCFVARLIADALRSRGEKNQSEIQERYICSFLTNSVPMRLYRSSAGNCYPLQLWAEAPAASMFVAMVRASKRARNSWGSRALRWIEGVAPLFSGPLLDSPHG